MIEGGVILRPRTTAASVDLGVALLRADLRTHARVFAPWFVVAVVIALGLRELHTAAGVIGAMWLGRLIQAPITRLAGDRVAGLRTPGPPRAAVRSWLGAHLLGTAAVLVANLIPVGGQLWWARLVFLPEVVVLEGAPSPLARSGAVVRLLDVAALVRIRLWLWVIEAFGAFGLAALLRFVFDTVLQLGSLGAWDGPTLLVGLLLVQPVVATVRLAFYLDTRTRAEALDAWMALWAAAGSRA